MGEKQAQKLAEKHTPVDILLDTNFLLVPFQFKIDIFSELASIVEPPNRFVVPSSVVTELDRLSRNKGKQGMAARFALKLVEVNKLHKKLSLVKGTIPVDDWIVGYAREHRAIVCTNDEKLRKRLLAAKARMIVVKSRSRLGVV